LGVWTGPPNVLLAPKPTSSVRINRIFGAPAGASTPFGKSGTEPFKVRSIFPWNGGSGRGNTRSVAASAFCGSVVDASADAARAEVEPSRRFLRLIGGDLVPFSWASLTDRFGELFFEF
jgi:hypothetical protein